MYSNASLLNSRWFCVSLVAQYSSVRATFLIVTVFSRVSTVLEILEILKSLSGRPGIYYIIILY